MGYRVDNTCYSTKEEAQIAYFSGIKPTIGTDGKLYQIQYDGRQFYFEGQPIKPVLIQCSAYDNMKEGMVLGWSIFAIFAVVWGFKVIQRIIGVRV